MHEIDHWREAHGGFRGSHLLLGGSTLLMAGALLSLLGAAGNDGLVEAGWLAYLLGLGVTGLGLGWSGVAGVLPRVALAAALLHIAQSAYLLLILYGRAQPPVAPVALTVGRLVAVLAFVAVAAPRLGKHVAWVLGGATGFALARTLVRVLWPTADGGPILDATLLLMMGAAIAATGRRLRALEEAWARTHHTARRSDFSEFNNPQHDWNKPRGGSGRA
ncbi:MAG: hypothetical protein IPK64_06590 [bacterium]|nr:hypothetical protein [bacterium]